MFQTTKGSYKS